MLTNGTKHCSHTRGGVHRGATGWWHSLLGCVGSTSSSEQVVLRETTHGHRARDKRCGRGCRQQPVLCTRRAATGQGQHAKERFQFSCLLHGTILVTSEGKERQTVAFALVPRMVPASSGHPDWKGHTATNRGAAGPREPRSTQRCHRLAQPHSLQGAALAPHGQTRGPTWPHAWLVPGDPQQPGLSHPGGGKRASRGAPTPYRVHFPVKTRSNLHPAVGSTCSSSGFKEAARQGVQNHPGSWDSEAPGSGGRGGARDITCGTLRPQSSVCWQCWLGEAVAGKQQGRISDKAKEKVGERSGRDA